MKKKLIGLLVFLIAMFGVMYFMGVFDAGEATKEDHVQGENTVKELEGTYENADMPLDTTADIEIDLEFNEDDPESML